MNNFYTVVIPCLNEEKFIGKLLYTLSIQSDQNFEVIVVDGKSEDKTIEVIHKFDSLLPQMRIVVSDRRGVAYQRNLGASHAKSEHILFLDADSRLDVDYIRDFKDEVAKSKADIATAYIWPDSKNPLDWFFWLGGNLVIDMAKYAWPFAPGMNMYLSKELFEKIGGFNKDIKVAEDADLLKRAMANDGKYVVLKKPKYFTDVRRLKTEGHMGYIVKLMLIAWQAHKSGSFEKVDVEYKMGDWEAAEKEKTGLLKQIMDKMFFWRDDK
jgi:glycosyltransferase involved in cell wall biosynthesis